MNELDLNQSLQSLVNKSPAMPRADEIEARLLAAFDAHKSIREIAPARNLWLPAIGLALAASLAAIGFLHDLPGRPTVDSKKEVVFLAIPYTIPPAPYESTIVVRMDVQVAALMAAGFKIQASDAATSIPADVLLAQDGRAVAIRPLTVPIL
jgi:hypothetical protein